MKTTAFLLLRVALFLSATFSFSQTYTSSLVAGTPPNVKEVNPLKFTWMEGMTINSKEELFVCDYANNMIRKIGWDYKIDTIAGNGAFGYVDGKDTAARFYYPKGIVADSKGNLFVIEDGTHVVRKITPDKVVSTFTKGPGQGFSELGGITIDQNDNLYVTDSYADKLMMIDSNAVVTTLFSNLTAPTLMTIDNGNHIIYFVSGTKIMSFAVNNLSQGYGMVADMATYGIMSPINLIYCDKYTLPFVSTGAGLYQLRTNAVTRLSTTAFYGAATSTNRGTLFGAYQNLYKYTYTSVTLLDIYPYSTQIDHTLFQDIQGMVLDAMGNFYLADRGAHRILKMDVKGTVSTFAGNGKAGFADSNGTHASFNQPTRLAWDNYGNLLVTDFNNNALRKISPKGDVTTFRDKNGVPLNANNCYGIVVDKQDNIYLADYGGLHAVKKITPDNVMSIYVDNTFMSQFGYDLGMPYALQFDKQGNLIIAVQAGGVIYIVSPDKTKVRAIGYNDNPTNQDGTTQTVSFLGVEDIVLDQEGNLFLLDENVVRMISTDSMVTTIAGNVYYNAGNSGGYQEGVGTSIQMNMPWCMAIDPAGDIYFSDNGNGLIRVLKKNMTTALDETTHKTGSSEGFQVYPNPAFGLVKVQSMEPGKLSVYNSEGKLVHKIDILPSQGSFDGQLLGNGIYYLIFQTNTQRFAKTLIIE